MPLIGYTDYDQQKNTATTDTVQQTLITHFAKAILARAKLRAGFTFTLNLVAKS